MKVKDLIKELQECNQNARVTIVVGDEDDNSIDTGDFELHSKDVEDYIELFVFSANYTDNDTDTGIESKTDNKLRIWHNSNFGKPPFTKCVNDIQTAKLLLNTLSKYDLYLGDKIVANAQGLEEFIGVNNPHNIKTNNGWIEWEDENGDNIDEY